MIILISNYAIADWIRQFVAFVVQSSIITLGHGYFLVLTRPTKENKTFPYHVKTNQIGLTNEAHNPDDNIQHHKEGEGGNTQFDDPARSFAITNLFLAPNLGEKYQLEVVNTNEVGY